MRNRGSRDSSVIEGIAADRAITPNIMAVRKLSFPMFVYTAMAVYTNIGKDSFLTAMMFGVIALSAAIPSMTEESREPRFLKVPALPD